jgi:hypothetical protein
MDRRFVKTKVCVLLQDVSANEVTGFSDKFLIFYVDYRDLIFCALHT